MNQYQFVKFPVSKGRERERESVGLGQREILDHREMKAA
jgi:hypothetical protein